MKHLGIDVHQKYSKICELSEAGAMAATQGAPASFCIPGRHPADPFAKAHHHCINRIDAS